MTPLGGPDVYWEKRAFQEAVRLVMRSTGLSVQEATHALLQEYQMHPADAQQALRESVDAVIARHPTSASQDQGRWRSFWRRLTR